MNTLESILVGIDGSERGKKALKWAARLANREQAHLTLLAVIDPASDKLAGSDHKVLRDAVENVLGEAQELVRADYPELDVDASYVSGDIVEALVGASESHDMIVMGSHHGATVAERVWSAGPACVGFHQRAHGSGSRRLGSAQRGKGHRRGRGPAR